ncbi:5-formyltetrahydrofolate cyclo-ligase [Nocardia sp. NPDC127579]|uniref:5-formyltetrahydrofolate cyclo-ligase n=1 Tax=Nocardia sp. NPDC127579 TaxID=3345402 RepID=UPI0036293D7F
MEMPAEADKHAWRSEVLRERSSQSAADHAEQARSLAETAGTLPVSEWVCAYMPARGEPGSASLPDALRAAGARVLLPVTGPPGPLDWAEYTGPDSVRPARFGLLEPTGALLGSSAVGRAGLILVPALAVDLRGVRLGRGAGYYDRTLAAARADARLIAVVRDRELVDRLPEEPHDLRMGWALTPRGGLRRLGTVE